MDNISDKALNELLNEIDKRIDKKISEIMGKVLVPYFGKIIALPTDASVTANVDIVENGIRTGLISNKTGVTLAVGDSVVVFAIRDNFSNCYIALKCGS